MKTVTIRLERQRKELEDFERDDKNVAQVRIRIPSCGEMITDRSYLVELSLSRHAMLGLGTELIRAAHAGENETVFWHLRPSEPTLASQAFGVYLHPSSCQLIIAEVEHGTLESLLTARTGADEETIDG